MKAYQKVRGYLKAESREDEEYRRSLEDGHEGLRLLDSELRRYIDPASGAEGERLIRSIVILAENRLSWQADCCALSDTYLPD